MKLGNIFEPEALLWGFLSITGISLLSLSGLAFIPFFKGKWRSRWMQMFIALAVSTMSCDAFLHILPQVLGTHQHGHLDHGEHIHDRLQHHHHDGVTGLEVRHNHTDHHHHHGQIDLEVENNLSDHRHHRQAVLEVGHNHTDRHHHSHENGQGHGEHAMLLKMTAVIASVYVLYLLEFISALPVWKSNDKILDISKAEKASNQLQDGWSETETGSDELRRSGLADEPVVMCGLKSAAFVIIFGDAIHNFIDGVAVGASFVISNQVGLATSLAVACHELPHELGDFAVLIESGLSIPRAMFLNFLSSLTAYMGLFVGLAAINVNSAVELLLAVTAGMFLYVAWLDMLVHLKTEAASKGDKWYATLLLQNIGFIAGFLIMFAIGWYEEALASL